jgi:DNA polymerase III subunit beta
MMKFSVQRDDLHNTINAVMRATATRVIQPILSNMLLELVGTDTLQLTATDMDFTIQSHVPAMVLQASPDTTKTTINAKKLAEIIARLPMGSTITFEINLTTQTAKIRCGASLFDLRTMPAEEYPLIKLLDADQYLELNHRALARTITQTAYAAASYETNNVLGGVYFVLSADKLELAATDGSRLACGVEAIIAPDPDALPPTDSLLHTLKEPIAAIIPAKTLQELLKLIGIGGPEDKVRLAIKDGQVSFRTDRFYVMSRLLDGQYPKYQQLIPKENKIVAFANKKALIESLERAAVMANDRTNLVKMQFDRGNLSVSANTPDIGDASDMLEVRYDGEPLNIAFNYRYVLDALKVIESNDVRMEMNGALAPTLFKCEEDNGYLCLVMPVQVK